MPTRNLYVETGHLNQPPSPPVTMMWGAGVALSALDAAARVDPDHYRTRLRGVHRRPQHLLDQRQPHRRLRRATRPEAQRPFLRRQRLDRPRSGRGLRCHASIRRSRPRGEPPTVSCSAARMINSAGGIYWHEPERTTKNTCVSAPAIVGALRLYQLTTKPAYLEDARRLYQWTCAHLQGADGLFADKINLDGLGGPESFFLQLRPDDPRRQPALQSPPARRRTFRMPSASPTRRNRAG